MSWIPPGYDGSVPGRGFLLCGGGGRAGNALLSAFSRARVLAWNRDAD